MRHKKKKIICRYTQDEDDIPLKLIKLNGGCNEDPNCYDSLCVPSRQPCELCDRVSENRYTSLIHNVKHIIIPLLNQTVHQCDICLHHFTSTEELTRHRANKHALSQLISQAELVTRNLNNPDDGIYESDLITIVKNEVDSPPKRRNATFYEAVTAESEPLNGGSLKNRLIFEEDIISLDCDRLLSDLTTDCQVKVELFPSIWQAEYAKSVHYSELVKPGVFRCKKCGQRFPSRYETIVHESHHLFIKNSKISLCKICNRYIVGDRNKLLDHKLTSHWNTDDQQKSASKDITTKDSGGKFEENGADVEPYTIKTTTLKLCDVCFSFCKNKSLQNYDFVGELSEVGKRYKCEKCGYKFFVIKLVKREIKYKYSSFAKKKSKAKGMSNETRLKIISNRFKMMKKTYFVVLFTNYLIFIPFVADSCTRLVIPPG